MENRKSSSVLFIGDIVGEAGREAVGALVPNLVEKYKVGFIVANCENAAAGRGVTPKISEYLSSAGFMSLPLETTSGIENK